MKREPRRQYGAARGSAGTLRAPWLPLVLLSVGALTARGDDVTLDVQDARGIYKVQGAFTAPVSTAVAWAVLSDYDHIGDFVKSVRASHVEERGDGRLLLRQEARGGLFPLQKTVHVQLVVREERERRIAFVDQLGQDFREYGGEWSLIPGPGGTAVRYTLQARPRMAMPRAIGRAWIGKAARDLLREVRVEMIRRAETTPRATAAPPHDGGGHTP